MDVLLIVNVGTGLFLVIGNLYFGIVDKDEFRLLLSLVSFILLALIIC